MNSKLAIAAILGIILTFALGATRTTYAAPPTDACSLLTPTQVRAVLGVSVSAEKAPALPDGSHPTCSWSQPGANVFASKRALLDIFGPMGSLSPVDRFNNAKMPVPRVTKTPLSGVGDDAIYITTGASVTGLDVRKGNAVFQIRVSGFPLEQIKEKEKALAQDVLERL